MKTQFMALNQVTFSIPMCLSAVNPKTVAYSIFLDQTPFGPHRAHISSPLLLSSYIIWLLLQPTPDLKLKAACSLLTFVPTDGNNKYHNSSNMTE